MARPPTCFWDLAGEAAALARAAVTYLIGVADPHDEDLIEIVPCGRDAEPAQCFATPVFLVHGFAHNWSAFLPLLARLERAGFRRFVRFNYDGVGDVPEEMAGALGRRVHEVIARTGASRVHFVGHSLGGVVARVQVGMLGGDAHLGHAVAIAAPLRGVPWARLPLLPRAFRELAPRAELLELLDGLDDDRSRWTTIAGERDLLVPPRRAHLKGARQITRRGLGHVGLLYAQEVFEDVVAALVEREKSAPPA
jgi:alpha-beta hydrolase superfamily lysophospholipase